MASAMFCLAGLPGARAQDASAWAQESHAAARLIGGSTGTAAAANFVRAGIEIRLDPGWKTYWRDPGDSGVPPTLDFSGSENVKSVTVAWPAPERFPDGAGGDSIGYMDRVILPLRVFAEDAAKPSSLHLQLAYAICGNLCVPAEAKLGLALSGNGAEEAMIEKAEQRVPRRVGLGEGGGLVIRAVHREAGGEHDRVTVDVAAPKDVTKDATLDLFVEGPTADWALPQPQPQPISTSGDVHRFTFDLDGLPADAHAEGALLTFTAVSGDDAIEVPVHLD